MEVIRQRVLKKIESLYEECAGLTRRLVSYPSLYGKEKEAQEFFASHLSGLGGVVDLWEPDINELKKHPAFQSGRESFAGSPVQVTSFPGKGVGRSMMLCGHMDVVPAGEGVWSYDPWRGHYENGRIYGRGAADMKGGLAAIAVAVQALKACGVHLKGDVLIATTVDEECGSTGVLAILEKGYRADACIIPEPTGLELNTASTGSIWFRIKVQGQAAHAGMAYKGVSAIEKAIRIIQSLKELEEGRRIRLMHPLYRELPIPFCLNVNTIQAGSWPAIVPPEAVMEGRMGVSPEESIEEARQELENTVARCAAGDAWLSVHPPVVEYLPCRWNSGIVAENHPFTQILKRTVEEILETPAKITGMGPCSDSGTLIRFGGIPTINFGPHSMAAAHQTDESVDLQSLLVTAQVLATMLMEWCGVAQNKGE